jgi:L-phenylalanine/L-methionine N-acetyltransferase
MSNRDSTDAVATDVGHAPMRVRRARPGDAAALVTLAKLVGAEPEGWLVTSGEWRSRRDERRYLRAVYDSPHAAVLVAEDGDEIVGRLSIVRDSHPACAHVADVGIMVARDRRRRGVGKALLRAAEQWARGAGIRKIELHVFPYNDAALRLYESAGYDREGYRRAHFSRAGTVVDAVLMAKHLPR